MSYANVVATLCLFLLLGGSAAYAAAQLAKNSVDTKQLKKGAVTAAKVKKHSLLANDFKSGQLPSGERGPAGPRGEPGERGEPGPLATVLPSGKTLTGIYAAQGKYVNGFQPFLQTISFQPPLNSAPKLNLLEVGDGPTAACPGSAKEPQAAPGNLCVYEALNTSGSELAIEKSIVGAKRGVALIAAIPTGENFSFQGSWAVTGS